MANEASVVLPALVRMGLAAAEDNPEIVPLAGGVSSLIVRVETRDGPLCIKQALPELKVASHWSAPLARNHAELAWIREVAQTLPEAVPGILGEDAQSYCFAMQWLAPEQHPVWKIQLRDGHVSPDFAAQVAHQLALIHAATANQPALAQRFAYDRNFFELRLDPYFGATAKVHADCAQMLQALIEQTANKRITLIHGDISPKNILAGPVGPIFLDAECAVYGDPAFDAAFCLTHLIAKCLWRPASTEDYLACFDAFTKHYLAGVDWENVEAIEARTAMLLAAILLARVDGKSPLEYLTESDRAQLRTFARRWLLSPATRLADMRAAWKEELAA
jgi:aminoglycoside phosphotransferase (APT) family kinase protein